MKKILCSFLVILFVSTGFTTVMDDVYICNSKTAEVYHATKSCRGLDRCTHEIKAVSKKDAVDVYGRRACKICY